MSTDAFTHLHCHSHYSLLDGAGTVPRLLDRAQELGMTALALTDHGNLHGAIEFYRSAKERGINPVIGYEAYIAPKGRLLKEASGMKDASFHLTLLAQNRVGFQNLMKLASVAFTEGFYFRPRIDKEILEAHNEGLICLSGCVSSEINRILVDGQANAQKRAEEVAAWYRSVFGDRYYIEIQNNGLEIQRIAMEGACELADRMGIPLVATSDVHYVTQADASAQDILLCVNTGKFRTDQKRMRMDSDQFYLRGPREMYDAFPGRADAVRRSQEIADGVDIELELGKRHFPVFTPPDGKSSEDYLRDLCIEGLKARYADNPERWSGGELSEEVMARLNRELGVINKLGFPNYFLIVWDFVNFSRDHGIPATARGSGVGALVCYALYLSHVCPLTHDLLFERFLDESRREAPDIDIDFCQQRRAEVIQYVKDRYGVENVAQIGTFGRLQARAAIRDVGRAMGMPIARVDAVVAMVPDVLNIKLEKAVETSDQLREERDKDPQVRELLDFAQQVEGLARNIGTHAAAVVIADRPLTDYVPLQRITGKEEIITQWSMNDVERAGLLKMDFLGLRNLTILAKAVELVEQMTGQKIDPHKFPTDDQATFDIFCRGETKGVFQFESGGIRELLQRMKPDHFRDIIATNALYRPGPLEGGMVDDYIEVKHGRRKPEYKHPVMEEVLAETNGVMVYQEQVMRILNRLGGIRLADAYTCIKAISKKKLELIAKFRQDFVTNSGEKGLPKNEAEDLFGLIEKFAGYGFNKSHSTAYALVAYMTAYLKAHYPVAFMAALLSSDISGRNFKRKDSVVEHMEDCKRMGIAVLPPDVNRSDAEFSVDEQGNICFALSAIKGCGGAASRAIAEERRRNGAYTSLFDFCERLDPGTVGRAAIETLVKAGAFDSLGRNRAQQFAAIDRALQSGASAAADRRCGQLGLFGDDDAPEESGTASLPDMPEWPDRERLNREKEVLGFYLTQHPLAEYEDTLAAYRSHRTSDLGKLAPKSEVFLGGMLAALKYSHTKNPKPGKPSRYVMFDLEDTEGLVRCIVWPDKFAEYEELIAADAILMVRGKVDKRPDSEEATLIVDELIPLDDLAARYTRGVAIRLYEEQHGLRAIEQLHEILLGYPGGKELSLVIYLRDGSRVPCSVRDVRVEISSEMRSRVEELLGRDNFRLITARPTPARPAPQRNGWNGNGGRGRG